MVRHLWTRWSLLCDWTTGPVTMIPYVLFGTVPQDWNSLRFVDVLVTPVNCDLILALSLVSEEREGIG